METDRNEISEELGVPNEVNRYSIAILLRISLFLYLALVCIATTSL